MEPTHNPTPPVSLPNGASPPDPKAVLLELRARAEKRRQLVTQATETHTPEEVQRLVHELQVHQIELEMQYEELLLAQAEAQDARAQYVDLYDFAPVGYFSLSGLGLITQLNFCGAKQLGTVRQRLVGRRFALFVAPAHRLEFGQFLSRVLTADTTQSIELMLQHENGTLFYGQLEGLRVDAPEGPQCRLAVLDTTARHEATAALTASEARFRKLFSDSNDAVTLLQGHHFVDCNAAALRLLGTRERHHLVGHPAWAHTPEFQPDGRRTIDLFRDSVAEAVRIGSKRCEALMHRVSGGSIWVEALLTPIELGGTAPVVHIVWRDITATRAAQQELRQGKEFIESLLENSVDGIVACDRDLRITAWNAAAVEYFAQEAAAALGRPLFEVLPHFATSDVRQMVHQTLAGERHERLHQPFPTRPGHYDIHLVPLRATPTARPAGVLVLVRDVTERDRLAEEATQERLRQQQVVLAAVLDTQETERKRIAEALHNGLGQLLYATKLNLERSGEVSRRQGPLKLLAEAIRTTRTLSFELTPGVLEDFGLRIALDTLAERLAPASLEVHLHTTGLEARLPAPVEIAVYRTVQELLNNVMKHANATEVEVHVAHENDRLFVSVEDNGRGFDPASLSEQPLTGIGLAGVRNRVALLGGQVSVDSRLGHGTIVSFELDA